MRRGRPRRRQVVALCAVLATAVLPAAWMSSATGASVVPQLSTGGTLTASSAQLTGLTYGGVTTVSTAAGDLPVIALTSTAATLTDLQLHVPCTAVPNLSTGLAMDTDVAAGSTADAPQGLTVYATSVVATGPSGPVAWTPGTPPPAAQLGDVGLTALTIDFAGIEAPSLSLPGLTQATRFCAP